MTSKNPLATITHVAVETLKVPVSVAGSVVGTLLGRRDEQPPVPVPTDVEPTPRIDPATPVNVTEALDLDPAPVAKQKPRRAPVPQPVTAIDAEADPSDVRATPADVADTVTRREASDDGHRGP